MLKYDMVWCYMVRGGVVRGGAVRYGSCSGDLLPDDVVGSFHLGCYKDVTES